MPHYCQAIKVEFFKEREGRLTGGLPMKTNLPMIKSMLWTGKVGMAAGALLLVVSGAAVSQDHGVQVFNSDAIEWGPAPPVLPKGAEAAVLSGDPGKAGPFTIRLKVPAGYKVPAHSHPTQEAVTVISGDFNIGMGDKLDEAKAKKLTAGGFVDLPANMNHFAFADTESIVQINSEGPFAINYVNPGDDPSKSQ
jgi:quercetin dioxygenase-like cupin family protein